MNSNDGNRPPASFVFWVFIFSYISKLYFMVNIHLTYGKQSYFLLGTFSIDKTVSWYGLLKLLCSFNTKKLVYRIWWIVLRQTSKCDNLGYNLHLWKFYQENLAICLNEYVEAIIIDWLINQSINQHLHIYNVWGNWRKKYFEFLIYFRKR